MTTITRSDQTITVTQQRRVALLEITYTCEICGVSNTVIRPPGFIPKYCLPGQGQKYSDCQRKATAARVRKHRRKASK